jgi:tubulin-specific chaperone A
MMEEVQIKMAVDACKNIFDILKSFGHYSKIPSTLMTTAQKHCQSYLRTMATKEQQATERQLMIKTKACQRLAKEMTYYEKEVKENEEKLAKMKQDKTADSYDIKKFEEVLGESYMMIPDSKARFQKSLEELSLFLDTNTVAEGEWVSTAQSILKENGISLANTAVVDETNVDDLQQGEAF